MVLTTYFAMVLFKRMEFGATCIRCFYDISHIQKCLRTFYHS